MSSMTGKTVVITGASSGIGFETARALAKLGARIVAVVRNRDKAQAAIDGIAREVPGAQLELVIADLYSLAEVRNAAAEIRARCPQLDVLINNAGLIHGTRELTVDGIERTFALNHLAAFLISYELRDLLIASGPSRIVTVASSAHKLARFEWNDLATMERWTGSFGVYGASKLCNIWFAREAARRLAGTRVTSNSLHPGAVRSNFGATGTWWHRLGAKLGAPFLLSVEAGARTSAFAASAPALDGVSGEYLAKSRIAKPSKRARDDGEAAQLWQLSERLCGVTWA